MKKLTAIFFLVFLSISQVGHLFLYYLQLQYIKHQVRNEILAGNVMQPCTVVEDNASVSWEEEGEEFSLNGDMYDVVAVKKVAGRTLLYCFNDAHEDQLLKTFARLIISTGTDKGKSAQSTLKFHITDQYILSAPPVLLSDTAAAAYPLSDIYGASLHFSEIHLPPPRA